MGYLEKLEREKREALMYAQPCPVCGSHKLIMAGTQPAVRCACMDCFTSGPVRNKCTEAVDAWNGLSYEKEVEE